jgi:hypothetical protein
MPAPGGPDTPHLWIYVTERHATTHMAVIVNVTTLCEGKDQTVILRRADHPFLVHESIVSYGHARIVDCRDIDANIAAKSIVTHQPCSAKLLKEVQDGLFASEHTPRKVLTFCRVALGK